nr:uncharacterized protein LOC117837142 isoform X2 [Setaria viridis]
MESVGERRAMENGGGTMRRLPDTGLVMCSTCSGFLLRMKRTSVPKPDEEVLEVVTGAEKMRALMKAVLLHGPLQEIEPAEATKEQWKVLQRRRRIMMETKKCPTCSGSLLEKPGPDEEDKAMVADPGSKAGSKEKMSSREEGSEFMAVLPSQGRKERMKIATEDEAMVADARSEQKLKRSREEGKRSSSGLKEKKKAKSEDKEGSGSKKKAKRSSEMEGSGSKEAKMKGSGLEEEAKIEFIVKSVGGDRKTKMEIKRMLKKAFEILNELPVKVGGDRRTKMEIKRMLKKAFEILNEPPVKSQSEEAKMEDSESAVGNRKTKMVTYRVDKKTIDFLKNHPPLKPPPIGACEPELRQRFIDITAPYVEVERVLLEYLQCHYSIKGYAEVQLEVTDDEGDDHKLV